MASKRNVTTWRIEVWIEKPEQKQTSSEGFLFGEFHIDMEKPPKSFNGDSVAQCLLEILTAWKEAKENAKPKT